MSETTSKLQELTRLAALAGYWQGFAAGLGTGHPEATAAAQERDRYQASLHAAQATADAATQERQVSLLLERCQARAEEVGSAVAGDSAMAQSHHELISGWQRQMPVMLVAWPAGWAVFLKRLLAARQQSRAYDQLNRECGYIGDWQETCWEEHKDHWKRLYLVLHYLVKGQWRERRVGLKVKEQDKIAEVEHQLEQLPRLHQLKAEAETAWEGIEELRRELGIRYHQFWQEVASSRVDESGEGARAKADTGKTKAKGLMLRPLSFGRYQVRGWQALVKELARLGYRTYRRDAGEWDAHYRRGTAGLMFHHGERRNELVAPHHCVDWQWQGGKQVDNSPQPCPRCIDSHLDYPGAIEAARDLALLATQYPWRTEYKAVRGRALAMLDDIAKSMHRYPNHFVAGIGLGMGGSAVVFRFEFLTWNVVTVERHNWNAPDMPVIITEDVLLMTPVQVMAYIKSLIAGYNWDNVTKLGFHGNGVCSDICCTVAVHHADPNGAPAAVPGERCKHKPSCMKCHHVYERLFAGETSPNHLEGLCWYCYFALYPRQIHRYSCALGGWFNKDYIKHHTSYSNRPIYCPLCHIAASMSRCEGGRVARALELGQLSLFGIEDLA